MDKGASNNITIWDVANGTALRHFTCRPGGSEMGTVFAIKGDGSRMVHSVLGASHTVHVADIDGGLDARFQVADELVTALAFSGDARTLITGSGYGEGAVKLWDATSGQLVGSLEGHRSWVSCLKILPDGKTLASASADRTIRLWDLETRRPLRTLRGYGGELWTMDVSPDGRWLASGGKDGSVILWDLAASTNRPPAYRTLQMDGRGAWWTCSRDGKWLATLHQRLLKLYDAPSLQLVSEPTLPLTNLLSMAFSPDSQMLVITDAQGQLGVWDVQAQQMVTNFSAYPGVAYVAPGFISNGRHALTFGTSNTFKEWEAATWSELRRWQADSGVTTWSVSPAANLLATGTGGGGFGLISIADPERRYRFNGQTRIIGVDLSPDGRTFVAASENGTVEIWDTETLTRQALLRGVLLGYHSVAISPDGERVIAGSNGQEAVKIWDLHSYEEVGTLIGQGSFFSDVAFSPDGNTIGARNWNGVLHLWRAPSWEEIEVAERTPRKP
jgi:WD40 repeat protein